MIRPFRFWMMSVFTLATFLLLVTRLGYVQIYCHAALYERAEREHAKNRGPLDPPRGQILDRDGRVLAMSIGGGSCFADPACVENRDEAARQLAPLLNLPLPLLKEKLSEHRRFVWLGRRLDPEAVQSVQELNLSGIHVIPELKRFYPEESLAAHVLGVVGENQKGLSGVEQTVDGWLRGRAVPNFFKEWTSVKHEAPRLAVKRDPSTRSVVLTLDRTLQYIAEQELVVQMGLSRPKSGTVIIEDPSTGEILAMATAPSFNPNVWGTNRAEESYGPEILKNFAVERVIEPGSTFKLITAAAAIEERSVHLTDGFFCENGLWEIQGRTIHDHEKEGWLTFTEVISHSSNIGTAKIALRLGQDNLYRYARAFGFGLPTGCGLPGDGSGILRPPAQWRTGSLMTVAFGQEVGVTPLQMVNAYAVIANGGWLMEPRLYKGLIDQDGAYREWAQNKPIRRVVSSRTVAIMRRILKDVVDHGTGKAAAVDGISVGGKTGTAQKIDPLTHQYSADRYVASFCGFAPVESPRIVIGVFLDEPRTSSYWGGSEAAPLFSRIVHDVAPYLQFKPQSSIGPVAVLKTLPRS